MRLAFLPGILVLLAGGVAWGQTTPGLTNLTARVNPPTASPLVLRAAQLREANPLILQAQNGPAPLTLLAPRGARQAASGPEPIPTQWPHAKLEPIPTQWKAQVVLLSGGPARPAGQSAGSTAGAEVRPK